MRSKHLFGVLVGFAAIAVMAADASAMYHPTLGRFMQRDPGPDLASSPVRIGTATHTAGGYAAQGGTVRPYADGMNLYQYVKANPVAGVDPLGLQQMDTDVLLHVDLKSEGGAGGSVEAYGPAGEKAWLHLVPEESWGRHVGYWLKSLLGASYRGNASSHKYETRGPVSWTASLAVHSQQTATGWHLQVCPMYVWELSIENVCCLSKMIRVVTRGERGPQPPDGGEVSFDIPESATHEVPVGGKKGVGQAVLKAVYRHKFVGTFNSSASVGVLIRCEQQ